MTRIHPPTDKCEGYCRATGTTCSADIADRSEGLMERRYKGPVEPGMIFTCPDNDGVFGFRRVRVVARRFDDETTLIIEDLPSRVRPTAPVGIYPCPELNLRIVFVPESDEVPR